MALREERKNVPAWNSTMFKKVYRKHNLILIQVQYKTLLLL